MAPKSLLMENIEMDSDDLPCLLGCLDCIEVYSFVTINVSGFYIVKTFLNHFSLQNNQNNIMVISIWGTKWGLRNQENRCLDCARHDSATIIRESSGNSCQTVKKRLYITSTANKLTLFFKTCLSPTVTFVFQGYFNEIGLQLKTQLLENNQPYSFFFVRALAELQNR